MLQSLRDKAQGWIAWIIIGLIAITFVLFGSENFFSSNANSDAVAEVQGTTITSYELDNAYRRYLNQAGNEAQAELDPNLVKKELLQAMIDETIMINDATKMGLTVSPQRVGLMLNSIPFFQVDGRFSADNYTRFLVSSGYSDATFKSYLKNALIKQQLEQGLMQTAFALPVDMNALVKYIFQKRDFKYFVLSQKDFESKALATDEEIKSYYDQHLLDFQTQERVSLEYVLLSMPELLAQYQPKDEEIQAYFTENQAAFNQPERIKVAHILVASGSSATEKEKEEAKKRIEDIAKKIKQGESFEALAKAHSDDKASGAKGGELEWISKGEMIPEFEKASFSLNKKNNISAVVKTDFGYHIIKFVDRQEAKVRKLEEVKEEVIAKMKHEWGQEKFAKVADELNDLAFDHPESLAPISEKLGLKIQNSDFFSKNEGPKEPQLQNPKVLASAFSSAVKDDKNNSELLKLDEENYMVVRVLKVEPAQQMPFDTVKSEIRNKVIQDKTEELVKTQASSMLDKMTKMSKEQLQQAFKWQEAVEVSRNSRSPDIKLIEAAFDMPYQEALGTFKQVKLNNGDYAIVWLNKVTDGTHAHLSKQEVESFNAQLAKHYGELEFALYATQLIKEAKVEKFAEKY